MLLRLAHDAYAQDALPEALRHYRTILRYLPAASSSPNGDENRLKMQLYAAYGLAFVYDHLGFADIAERYFQQASQLFLKLSPTEELIDWACDLHTQWALCAYEDEHRSDRAEWLYKRALRLCLRVYDTDMPRYLLLLERLGTLYLKEKAYEKARKIYAWILPRLSEYRRYYPQYYGEEHAQILGGFAVCCEKTGRRDMATETIRKMLDLMLTAGLDASSGADLKLRVLLRLGLFFEEHACDTRACHYLRKALERCRELNLPESSPEYYNAMGYLMAHYFRCRKLGFIRQEISNIIRLALAPEWSLEDVTQGPLLLLGGYCLGARDYSPLRTLWTAMRSAPLSRLRKCAIVGYLVRVMLIRNPHLWRHCGELLNRHLLDAIGFLQAHVNALGSRGRHVLADEVGADGQFPMPPVQQHKELHRGRTTVIVQRVQRRADGTAPENHVVHQNHPLPRQIEGQAGFSEGPERTIPIVAIEGDVERPHRYLTVFELAD
jgi:tetratricopeptide (TPR) repeat protein